MEIYRAAPRRALGCSEHFFDECLWTTGLSFFLFEIEHPTKSRDCLPILLDGQRSRPTTHYFLTLPRISRVLVQ